MKNLIFFLILRINLRVEEDVAEHLQLMYPQPMRPETVELYCNILCPCKVLQPHLKDHKDWCPKLKALHRPTL